MLKKPITRLKFLTCSLGVFFLGVDSWSGVTHKFFKVRGILKECPSSPNLA
jgi:hypothetical protein